MANPILVAYFSKGGAAGQYARQVAETLEELGHPVELVDLHVTPVKDLAPYRCVVLGTGVRIGIVYRGGKAFLRRKDLKDKPLAIFLASGIAVQDRERALRRFLAPLARRFGLHPLMLTAFPGKLPDKQGRLIDHTRTELAREWARELDERLTRETSSA